MPLKPVLMTVCTALLAGLAAAASAGETAAGAVLPVVRGQSCETLDRCRTGQCEICQAGAAPVRSARQPVPWWRPGEHSRRAVHLSRYHPYLHNHRVSHPIAHPYNMPGWGYYETCWRRFPPMEPCPPAEIWQLGHPEPVHALPDPAAVTGAPWKLTAPAE